LLTWHSLCVPKECSMTKLEHKTSLHSSLVRWGESCFLNEVHRSRVYQIKKWNSWITCYDVQTWHVDVFKLLALNAGSSTSSYWNSPVNGKWGSQTDFKEEETAILVQWSMWSLLTSSIFARWNCWTTEQIIPVRFTELTSHHWTDFPSSWFPFQVHKDLISMSQRSVWTARTLGLLVQFA
jgi:hypothetical protein